MDICQNCLTQLVKNDHCCYRCGEILNPNIRIPILCGHCLNQPPAFDETSAPYIYQGFIQYLISGLKFNGQFNNARLLGQLLAEHINSHTEKPELLIPVPLHKSRYRERGFNQAIEIARTVSKQLSIPLELNLCTRVRDTGQQSRLSAKARRKNLKNAFKTNRLLNQQHIAIIDDVMTTGTTTQELANCLKKAGAARIDIWVCARA